MRDDCINGDEALYRGLSIWFLPRHNVSNALLHQLTDVVLNDSLALQAVPVGVNDSLALQAVPVGVNDSLALQQSL